MVQKNLTNIIATRDASIDFMSIGQYLPDPDVVLKKKGSGVKILKELTSDSHIFACWQSRKSGVKSLEWGINRGKTKNKQAKVIEDLFSRLDIYNIIAEILDAPFWGFQTLEIMWEIRDGLYLPKDIQAKPSEWFVFDEQNNLRMLTKQNRMQGQELPEYKFLLAQYNATYDNPYGERILSRCFWPYTFKKGGMKFWLTFIEKYGMAHAIAKHPRSADAAETEELAAKMELMVQDAIAVIPDDSSIEFLEAAGKSASADLYQNFLEFFNKEISKAILGQTLTTEVGSNGSYAASKTHQEVRKDLIEDDRRMVENCINQLIQWICELNFPTGEVPTFEMWEEENVDKTLAERDQILSATGIQFTKEYYKKSYGLEDGDFEVSQPQSQPQPTTPANFAEATQTNSQEKINELIDLASSSGQQLQNILNPLVDLIQSSSDYSEALNKLAELYPKMDDSELINRLEKAYFIADIIGRLNDD